MVMGISKMEKPEGCLLGQNQGEILPDGQKPEWLAFTFSANQRRFLFIVVEMADDCLGADCKSCGRFLSGCWLSPLLLVKNFSKCKKGVLMACNFSQPRTPKLSFFIFFLFYSYIYSYCVVDQCVDYCVDQCVDQCVG